ncbi:MAG: flagellar hook-associated protein FlgK [Halopseudomonas sp.]
MAGSISIALQGLSVAQRGFEVASNNIANVNTPGYSRQQIDLSSRAAPEQGVQILSVGRVVDAFATQQHWSSSAAFKSTESFSFFAGQIDDLLANPNTSISAAVDEFFGGLQTGVDDPSSIPNRELIVAQSEALARRFVEIDRQLRAQNDSVNSKLGSSINEVNEMAGLVASLNDKIRLADSRGDAANELKDQRDQLVLSISEQIGGIVQTGTGSTDINLYVGNGQPLVVGGNASNLVIRQGNPDINDVDIVVEVNGKEISVRDQINEGEVGGMLAFRDEVLVPAWNELGRLAIVFADTANQQHQQGVDLDGKMAGNWFADPVNVGDVKAFSSNNSPLSSISNVVIRDSGLLQSSDYQVKFGKNGAFAVTRISDGEIFTQADFAARDLTQPATGYQDMTIDQDVATGQLRLNLDGIDIDLKTSNSLEFSDTDKVLIQPVRFGAELMEVELSSGRELAFASPVRSETAVDNTGTLSTGNIAITDPVQFGDPGDPVSINPPVQIVFNSDGTYNAFDITDPSNPVAYVFDDASAATNRTYQEGAAIAFNGFEVVVSGKPSPGDKVSFTANADAVSDNRNALQLSDLQQQSLVDGATYQDNYGRLVERIGTQTSVSLINLQANETIMLNAESVRNGISGVNLDEEAANIINFQQQYQAASQVINTARNLFETLLSAVG